MGQTNDAWLRDIGPLPERHPREASVEEARVALWEQVQCWAEIYKLTSAEMLNLLSDLQRTFTQQLINAERKRK